MTFKTGNSGWANTADPPGDVVSNQANGLPSNWVRYPLPTQFEAVSVCVGSGRKIVACTKEGFCYKSDTASDGVAGWVQTTEFGPQPVSVWKAYNVQTTWLAQQLDGTLVGPNGVIDVPGGGKVLRLKGGGDVQKTVLVEATNGWYAFSHGESLAAFGTQTIGSSLDEIVKLEYTNPPGREFVDFCAAEGNYDFRIAIGLCSDGTLWCSGSTTGHAIADQGLPSGGTNDDWKQITVNDADSTKFVSIGSMVGYADWACWSAVTDDGDLWIASGRNNRNMGTISRQLRSMALSNVTDPAIGMYNVGQYVIPTVGSSIYTGNGTQSPTLRDLAPNTPTNPDEFRYQGPSQGFCNAGSGPILLIMPI